MHSRDATNGAASAEATERMLPCPSCTSTNVDATFAAGHNNQVNAGCMVCGMTGPDAYSAKDAADRWNELPRHAPPSETVAPVAWRTKRPDRGHDYWIYYEEEPRFPEDGPVEPLYAAPQMPAESGVLNQSAVAAPSPVSATRPTGWTFNLDAAQVEKMEAWRKEQDALVLERQRKDQAGDPFIDAVHAGGSPYYGAIGGELTFSFSPNSLGEVQKVKHGGTGAELDLTDYNW